KLDNFAENIAILREGNKLSVEARPWATENDTIWLGLYNTQARNYSLQFLPQFMQAGLTAILQDTYLGKSTDIPLQAGETSYNFSITGEPASANANRFRIVFTNKGILPTGLVAKAYPQNSGVQIDWNATNDNQVKNYEVEKIINGNGFAKMTT